MLTLLNASNWFLGGDTALILALICFIIGLVLCVVEMFMPGFGVAGITGVILLFAAVLLKAQSLAEGIVLSLSVIVILCVMVFFSVRSMTRGKLAQTPIVLHASTDEAGGFSSVSDKSALLGLEGVAHTTLRPTGAAEIGGERVDVVTDGEFIEAGTPVKVVRVEGYRVVVQETGA